MKSLEVVLVIHCMISIVGTYIPPSGMRCTYRDEIFIMDT